MQMRTRLLVAAALIGLGSLAGVTAAFVPRPEVVDPELVPLLARAPVWRDEFSRPPRAADWDRGMSPWPNTIANRTLPSGERQVYIDKAYLGRDLLRHAEGVVTLPAERMTATDRRLIDARLAGERVPPALQNALRKANWDSTLIKGKHSFQYGYVEARIRADDQDASWTAFWLLPQKWGWPPEIDILEIPGDRAAHQTLHSLPGDPPPHPTVKTPLSPGWHTYGVLWEREFITFFVDRKRTARFPTPRDMHQPMYPILNLGVGGWAKGTDEAAPKELRMDVDYVRWWQASGRR